MTREAENLEASDLKASDLKPPDLGATSPETDRGLPPCAGKADDLDAIRKSVDDAAAVSGGLWLSYLFVLFYLAIAAGAVTHIDLFLENAVKLPFLSVELPIKAFFFLAPLILCVTHVYTLTSFVLLSDKAKSYQKALTAQIAGDDDPRSQASLRAEAIRNGLRRQLPSNIFVQFLAGPDDIRSSLLGLVLKTIAWVTLVIAPVLLLLLLQLQFLAYHSQVVTWTARITLFFDILAVWWLWHAILLGRGDSRRLQGWGPSMAMTLLACLTACAVVFSWAIATFPGEWLDNKLFAARLFSSLDENKDATSVSLHDYLFSGPINSVTRRRDLFFSSTLVLPVFNIFEQLKIDESKALGPFKYVFHARGRDFSGADFDLSNLSNVDFEGSLLEGASLDRAKLQNASLFCARLQGAILSHAELQGAWFYGTDLHDAELDEAKGQGAMFDGAQLQSADLDSANFQAASFQSADLSGATFEDTKLEAASFEERTDLAADCIDKGRATHGADLAKSEFKGSSLVGTAFTGARLLGATHEGAKLDGSDFISVSRGEMAPDHPVTSHKEKAFLAKTFRTLVCSGDANAVFVLRGLLATDRLAAADQEVLPLLKDIRSMSSKCPVSMALGEFDKTNLLALQEKITSAPKVK